MTANIPPLPTENILEGWLSLSQQGDINDPQIRNFVSYFEKQWLKLLPQILSSASETNRTDNGFERMAPKIEWSHPT